MKMSKININIGSTDVDKLIKALNNLQKDLEQQADNIAKDVSEKGLKYLNKKYTLSPNRNDPNIDIGGIKTTIEKIDNGYRIVAKGKDIIYEEFGTGDEGQSHSHPNKSKYDLNDYNNGGTILNVNQIHNSAILNSLSKKGVTNGNFWFYKKHKQGSSIVTSMTMEQKLNRAKYLINHSDEVIISQGVKAGKEMWNTRNYIVSKKSINKIVRKRGKEISDKFIKSIT